MPHSAFSLFSFIHQEISNERIFLKSWVFWSSVSYVSSLICFASHTYEWIIKARKIGQHQWASLSPVLLKYLTCQILRFSTFLLLLVCSLSIFEGQRRQVFSLSDEYVVINFHMVPDKCLFHFISIAVGSFLKSLHFCGGMTWKPPRYSYGEIISAPSQCQREAKKASVADLPGITWLRRTSAENENKESNSNWKSSCKSQDECDVRCDVFSVSLGNIFFLFLWVFTNSSRGVKTLTGTFRNWRHFFLTKGFTAHDELALTRIADIHWQYII